MEIKDYDECDKQFIKCNNGGNYLEQGELNSANAICNEYCTNFSYLKSTNLGILSEFTTILSDKKWQCTSATNFEITILNDKTTTIINDIQLYEKNIDDFDNNKCKYNRTYKIIIKYWNNHFKSDVDHSVHRGTL